MTDPLPLLLDLLVRSTLLIAFAWATTAVLRKVGASAARRHLVWLCAMAGLVVLPLLAITMPPLPLAILPEAAAPLAPGMADVDAAAPLQEAGPVSSLVPTLLLCLYLAMAGGMLAWLLSAQKALAAIWRASGAPGDEWTALLSRAAGDLRMAALIELRLAHESVMPMTWGTRSPKILLPIEARTWTLARRRLVLLHELGHVRRRDSLTQTIAAVIRALWWFQPAAWFAVRQLRLEQELAADDLALNAGALPSNYARNLLDLACAFCLPTPAMARRSQLERRLAAIVRPTSRQAPSRGFGATATLLILAATWLSATATPVMTASPPPPLSAAPSVSPSEAISAPSPVGAALATAPRSGRAAAPDGPPPPAGAPPVPPPVTANAHQSVAAVPADPAADYAQNLAQYRQEKVKYEADVAEYRVKLARYRV
jgi:beta-lactamase regulating signal transducer with metallopeptidase domain